MPDRIPQLDHLADQAKEVPMLPPSEIRRRGNRRRLIRHTAVGAVIAVFLGAAGFTVWQSSLLDSVREQPQWATTMSASPTPTPSPSASPSEEPQQPTMTPSPQPTAAPPVLPDPPTWDNVPDAQIMYPYDPSVIAETRDYEGLRDTPTGLCDPGSYGDPSTVLVREFLSVDQMGAVAIVFGYPDEASAQAGYALLEDAARYCPTAIGDPYYVSFEDGEGSSAYISSIHPADNPDEGWFNDTHLIQDAERVLWRVNTYLGQDQNCSVLPNDDAMQCESVKSADAALERLRGE